MQHVHKLTLIFFMLMIALKAIHLQHQTQHIQSLKNIQQALVADTAKIKLAFQQYNPLSLGSKSIDQKIKIIEELLITQRVNLLSVIKSYHYNLNNTPWTCQSFSPIANSHFQQSFKNIKQKYQTLVSYLRANTTTIPSYKSILDFSSNAESFLKIRQSSYFSTGKEQSFAKQQSKKVSNLNAGLWALGNTTPNSLSQQLNNVTAQPSVEVCPFYVPYADREGRCKQCPRQRPYFILQGQSCFSCSVYNTQKRQCYDQRGAILSGTILFTNYAAAKERILLLQNQTIDRFSSNTQNLPVCPSSTPFFNGKECMDCPKQLYFSPSQNVCKSCPSDHYYQSQTMSCKRVKYYSRASSLSWSTQRRAVEDILQDISMKKSQINYRECPQKTPFSLDSQCISCDKPTHFSYDSLKCQQCPQKTILNLNMHRCVKIGNINYQTNPMNSPKLILNGKSLNEWANIYYTNLNNQSGISDCPNDTPYFDGIACISCPKSHPYFNLQKLICQYCEGTTIYDSQQRQCISNLQKRAVQVPTWQKMAAAVFS